MTVAHRAVRNTWELSPSLKAYLDLVYEQQVWVQVIDTPSLWSGRAVEQQSFFIQTLANIVDAFSGNLIFTLIHMVTVIQIFPWKVPHWTRSSQNLFSIYRLSSQHHRFPLWRQEGQCHDNSIWSVFICQIKASRCSMKSRLNIQLLHTCRLHWRCGHLSKPVTFWI